MKKYSIILFLSGLLAQTYSTQSYQLLTNSRIGKLSLVAGIAGGLLIKPQQIHNVLWKHVGDEYEKENPSTNLADQLAHTFTRSSLGSWTGYKMAQTEWPQKYPDTPFSYDTSLRILGGASTCITTALILYTAKWLLK